MIKLFFAPQSRAIRILWLLEEMRVPYELQNLDLTKSEQKSEQFLRINPMGKVPTVIVNGKSVWESPAIIMHLTDLHPDSGLSPAIGSPARADFYRWLSFGTAVMEPAFMDHMTNQTPNPVSAGWGSFQSMKIALAEAFQPGPWVLGELFSGADIIIGSNLNWFTMWKAEAFKDIPGINEYVERIRSRDAFKKAHIIEAEIKAGFEKI